VKLGHYPYVPHLNAFWHLVHPRDHHEWLDMDFVWLEQCNVLLRLPGDSRGADAEVRLAHEIGIPVYLSMDEDGLRDRLYPCHGTSGRVPFVGTVDVGACFHCWEDGHCKTCGAARPDLLDKIRKLIGEQ